MIYANGLALLTLTNHHCIFFNPILSCVYANFLFYNCIFIFFYYFVSINILVLTLINDLNFNGQRDILFIFTLKKLQLWCRCSSLHVFLVELRNDTMIIYSCVICHFRCVYRVNCIVSIFDQNFNFNILLINKSVKFG